MERKKLVIFPCNGNGIEAIDCIDPEQYDLVGFVDDEADQRKVPYTVYSRTVLDRYPELHLLAVPGSPLSYMHRDRLIQSLPQDRFISLIHPKAIIGHAAQIGHNCLIMAGVVLTSNARIGDHVCILPNSVIHHDSYVSDYTLIGTNVAIAGGVTIEKKCYIGSGSNICNGITIGQGSLIGLGSNVLRNVPEMDRVAGNPAKSLRKPLIHPI